MTLAQRQVAKDRVLFIYATVFHFLSQVFHLNSVANRSEFVQRILSILFCLICATYANIYPLKYPNEYMKQRTKFVLFFRLVYFAFPLLRRPRGIQRVLDAEPLTGKLGIIIDMYKVMWGCRLVAVVTSAFIALPFWLHLPVQLYSSLAVRGNKSLCETELLSHPITAARIAAFHSWADRIAQPVLSSLGFSELFAVALSPKDQCEVYLNWMSAIVGYVVPTIVVVKYFKDISRIGVYKRKSGNSTHTNAMKPRNVVMEKLWWLFGGEGDVQQHQNDGVWGGTLLPFRQCSLIFAWWMTSSVLWYVSRINV